MNVTKDSLTMVKKPLQPSELTEEDIGENGEKEFKKLNINLPPTMRNT